VTDHDLRQRNQTHLSEKFTHTQIPMPKPNLIPKELGSSKHYEWSTYVTAHQTMPCAPEPIGLMFWYRLRIVNVESPTSTV